MTMSLVQETAFAAYPKKLFYRIHEVAEIAGVKPHVLRYWETQFKQLAPEKDRSDQRRYQQPDVDVILRIRRLLYDEKFTIAGARKQFDQERMARRKQSRLAHAAALVGPVRVVAGAPRRGRRSELAKIRADLCDLMMSLRA